MRFSNVHVSPASSCSPSSNDALNPSSSIPARPSPRCSRIRRLPAVVRVLCQRRHEIVVAQLASASCSSAIRVGARSMFSQISNRFAPSITPRLDLRAQERFSARQQRRADAHIHGGFQPLPSASKPTRYAPSTCISSALSASTSSIRTPPASSTSVSVCARTAELPVSSRISRCAACSGSASARRWAASRAFRSPG